MTNPSSPHQKVIAAALEDWWITTDPAAPFEPADVAESVEQYLLSSGYYIAPDTGIPAMRTPASPSRGTVAFTVFLVLTLTAGGLVSLARHEWLWALAGAVGAVLFTWEVADELAERRAHRRRTTR